MPGDHVSMTSSRATFGKLSLNRCWRLARSQSLSRSVTSGVIGNMALAWCWRSSSARTCVRNSFVWPASPMASCEVAGFGDGFRHGRLPVDVVLPSTDIAALAALDTHSGTRTLPLMFPAHHRPAIRSD